MPIDLLANTEFDRKRKDARRDILAELEFEKANKKLKPAPAVRGQISMPRLQVSEPSFMGEVVKPTLQQIGKGFGQYDIRGFQPLTATKETAQALGYGMVGFLDSELEKVQSAAQQALLTGKIDWRQVKRDSEKVLKNYGFEPTDPAAKLILGTIGAVPGALKATSEYIAQNIDNPSGKALMQTFGDIAEIYAFGKVFKTISPKGKVTAPPLARGKAPALDTTFAREGPVPTGQELVPVKEGVGGVIYQPHEIIIEKPTPKYKAPGKPRQVTGHLKVERPAALPAGQGFEIIKPKPPARLEGRMVVEKPAALPPGQGFELIETPEGPRLIKPVRPSSIRKIEADAQALEKFRNQKTHIPKFRNSQEAINFGRQAQANTKLANQLSALETRSRELSTRYREANESQKAMDAATEAQFYREALEAQRGEIKEPGKVGKLAKPKKVKAKKFKESENLLAAIRRRGGLSTQEFKGEYKGAPGYVKLLRRRKGGMAIGDMDKILKEEKPDLLGQQDNLRDIIFGDPERLKRKGYGKLVEMEEFKKQQEPPEVEYSKEQEAKDLKELEKYFAEQGRKAEKPRLVKPEVEKPKKKTPYFTLYKAYRLISKNWKTATEREINKAYPQLRDYIRYIESPDNYSKQKLIKGGYFKKVEDPSATGLVPTDPFLLTNLRETLNEVVQERQKLIESEKKWSKPREPEPSKRVKLVLKGEKETAVSVARLKRKGREAPKAAQGALFKPKEKPTPGRLKLEPEKVSAKEAEGAKIVKRKLSEEKKAFDKLYNEPNLKAMRDRMSDLREEIRMTDVERRPDIIIRYPKTEKQTKLVKEYLDLQDKVSRRMKEIESKTGPELIEMAKEPETLIGVTAKPSDISLARAQRAHAGTSFVPEKRGLQEQQEYVSYFNRAKEELSKLAKTDEQKAIMNEELARYRERLIAKYNAVLDAKSRTMSAMITGPSRFPTARNRKALDTEMRRYEDLTEWDRKARRKMRKKVRPDLGPISSDQADAVELLEKKIADAQKHQETMKAINKIVRGKKLSDAEKVKKIQEDFKFKEETAKKILEPDYAGRKGFPQYELQNNNANIRRMKERVELLKKQRSQETTELELEGAKIVDNVEENRVQILFDGKPPAEVRSELKSKGFRWAPSQKAWQRKRSAYALDIAKNILKSQKGQITIKFEPKIVEPSDVPNFKKGNIIKERKWKSATTKERLSAPPIYEAEMNVVKDIKELRRRPLGGWTENPIRVFEEMGEDAKELFYEQMIDAYDRLGRERKMFNEAFRDFKKGTSIRSRKRIGIYAISKQKGGAKRLQAMGIKTVPKLTEAEAQTYAKLRDEFEIYFDRLNQARAAAGKEKIRKVENYFTFMRDMNSIERMGFNISFTKLSDIEAQFVKMKTTGFRFAKARAKFAPHKLQLDAFNVFEEYANHAMRHIHLSPTIAKLREMTLTFGSKKEGTAWRLREQKPNAYKFINEWLNHQAGWKAPTFLPESVDKLLNALNKNLTFSILSANIRSALIQPSALRNTYVEIGPKYTLEGIASLFSPKKRNFALEKSRVLHMRDYDVAARDALEALRQARFGVIKRKVGGALLKPLQILDMEAAKATWQGAYNKAVNELKFKHRKAVRYADDVVTKTQASASPADIAKIQRTVAGKTIAMFQTFVINEWNFLIKDTLGIRNPNITTAKALQKATRFIVATTLINMFFEDLLGINSPYPSPITAFNDAIEEGKDLPSAAWDVTKELSEQVPIIGGGIRYGRGLTGAVPEAAGKLAKGEKTIEQISKLLGVPGTVQISKYIKGQKKGATKVESLIGSKNIYERQKTRGRLARPRKLKRLKGLK